MGTGSELFLQGHSSAALIQNSGDQLLTEDVWNEGQAKWPRPSSHRGPLALLRSFFHQLHIPSSLATGFLLRSARG